MCAECVSSVSSGYISGHSVRILVNTHINVICKRAVMWYCVRAKCMLSVSNRCISGHSVRILVNTHINVICKMATVW